jgi:hypothetical protein
MSFGCELDQAFGSLTDQEKKLKKKKDKREKRDESGLFTEKKNVDIIFPHELKPVQEPIHQQDNLAGLHEDILLNNNQFAPYHRYNLQHTDNKKLNTDISRTISDKEYQVFKEYQRNRSKHVMDRPMIESFTNDEEFNDVLLFALTGIFF